MVRTLVSVAVLCAMVALGGGCASHKRADREAREARAKGIKIPSDRSVLSGVARGKSAGAAHPGSQAFVAATPAPAPMPMPAAMPAYTPAYTPAPAALPSPAATASPQFQPVDPTDYAAPRPAYASVSPAPTPAPVPAAVRRPVPLPPPQPASARLPKAGAGSRYQVQKGDTLFGIARTRYGDGKRWQQIASANPGLTPANLQAGATIVVP